MRSSEVFDGLPCFLAVARAKSFRAAARELGVTPGAVSQGVRVLEQRVGLPLFQRTTRRVSLTDAGEALFARAAPAALEIRDAFEALDALRQHPSGTLRITAPRLATEHLLDAVIAKYRAAYPEVTIELALDDAFVDLAESGYDAGIRLGEAVAKDMVGVRLTRDLRWLVVGAPSYFAEHGHPSTLRELLAHTCIGYRMPRSQTLYKWELVDDAGRDVAVDVPGPIIVNDGTLMLALAERGLGLMYGADLLLAPQLKARTLVPTLETHAASSAGLYVYFAARSRRQPKLRAFVDLLVEEAKPLSRKRSR